MDIIKRLYSLLLVFLFCFVFSACSNNDVSESNSYDNMETDSDYSLEETYDLESLEADDALDFVNGKAWIRYDTDDFDDNLICIDKDGRELFSITSDVSPLYASPFIDDTAFIVYSNNSKAFKYSIVDTSGDELYSSTSSSSSDKPEEHVLAYGDGKYVVLRHISNIDDNYWEIGTIDPHGKTIDEFKTFDLLDEDFVPEWGSDHYNKLNKTLRRSYNNLLFDLSSEEVIPTYVGEGYFMLINNHSFGQFAAIYNPSEGSLIRAHMMNPEMYYEASNGYTLMNHNSLNVEGKHICSRLNLKTGEWEKITLDCNDSFNSGGESIVKDDLFFYGHGYYDINGKEIIHIKGFDDKQISCSPFFGEYATLTLEGADGNQYVTVIDSNGDSQFEPKVTDGISLTNDNGYFVSSYNGKSYVYDSSGKIVRPLPLDGSYDYIVSEGFVRATKEGSSSYLFKIPD